jgi:hypothetical protein
VKAGLHVPIYHWGLRACHIAPALALAASYDDTIRSVTEPAVDTICSGLVACEQKLQKIWSIIFE